MKRLMILLTALCLFALPALAESPAVELMTYEGETFSFSYPKGWKLLTKDMVKDLEAGKVEGVDQMSGQLLAMEIDKLGTVIALGPGDSHVRLELFPVFPGMEIDSPEYMQSFGAGIEEGQNLRSTGWQWTTKPEARTVNDLKVVYAAGKAQDVFTTENYTLAKTMAVVGNTKATLAVKLTGADAENTALVDALMGSLKAK